MKSEEKIRKALEAKNWTIQDYHWEPVQYFGEGREGGYEIDILIDDDLSISDEQEDKYRDAWEKVNEELTYSDRMAECDLGTIRAYNVKDVLFIIEQIPDRLTLAI